MLKLTIPVLPSSFASFGGPSHWLAFRHREPSQLTGLVELMEEEPWRQVVKRIRTAPQLSC